MHFYLFFFFFNDTATTEIYTLFLHDALPIWRGAARPLFGETARGLGMDAGRMRVLLLAVAAALAGATVSFAGLLGFVGLVTPHIMRRFSGGEARALLPACALGGAVLLLVCDTASRLVFAPYELPVGITLSLIGGPFFIWLLLRQRRGRTA